MTNYHIAFFVPTSSGHINPSLGLVSELTRRGHRITYTTDHYFSERIIQLGAEPITYVSDPFIKENPPPPVGWDYLAAKPYMWLISEARNIIEQLYEFYCSNKPDLVVYDRISYAGRIIAKRFSVPAIQLWSSFAFYDGFFLRKDGKYHNPEPILRFAEKLDDFFKKYGINSKDNFWHVEDQNICFYPERLQHNRAFFDERYYFAGPALAERPFFKPWKKICNSKNTILVSMTTASRDSTPFFNNIIDTFHGLPYNVILSVGDKTDFLKKRKLSKNFFINRRSSNLEILKETDLFIYQGGLGSSLEALSNGASLLVIPEYPDHEEVAFRIAELELGVVLERFDVHPESLLSSSILAMSDPKILSNVQQIKREIESCGGAAGAADKVESVMVD